MKFTLACGTLSVLSCLFLVVLADETVPQAPPREIEIDQGGNLVLKTESAASTVRLIDVLS